MNKTIVTDINLLRDRSFGDESQDEKEKQKRKSRKIVELSNPGKERVQETTEKPGGSFWSFIKNIFTGGQKPAAAPQGAVRILHEEKHPAAPESSEAPAPKIKLEERYVTENKAPTPLEDVFSPSQKPEGIEETPAASPEPSFKMKTPAPDLSGGMYSGSVNTPPGASEKPLSPLRPEENPLARDQGTHSPEAGKGGDGGASETFLGVNLIPEEMMSGGSHQNRLVTLSLIAAMSVLIVGLAYVGLSIYQSRIVNETQAKNDEILSLDRQIQSLNEKKRTAIQFHDLTKQTINLLDTHVYWTKFFGALEKYTVLNVAIRSFTADQAGHLTLSLSGRDYRAVAQQLLAFEAAEDFVSDVTINAAAFSENAGSSSVDFTAIITLDPDVFYRDAAGGPSFRNP